ncbi:Zinc finger PHD-finger [Penicillium verrucosum]|uniref:Zinc finger PHD-finger n=1 Tax=Penicillium verrucosum TaxID=60171 RepID=UPI00254533A4|nr:Zinc finger PHD-finger [Penicillium verrucosum]KAJ5940321.1 Zinc finger PHD-finger [Penicillium verrucosum]
MVELSDSVGGAVTSSYAVQDRTQVAEVDPSMIIEYVEDDLTDFQPCTICGQADNEDVLLLCDGCDGPSHLYCLGLDEIPSGSWYCQQCEELRALGPAPEVSARPSRAIEQRSRRTRAQQRRLQNRTQTNSLHWARVWQSVWDHLNLDLDFPFDDDRSAERAMQQRRREEANQREFQAWQRRFEVAERQGGGSRFRDTASLFDLDHARPSRPRVPRVPTPEPESLEEMRAWNAFERAREIENNPSAARKRKEPTMSPSPEPTEPERKLKRPRTRRPQELAARAQQTQNGESSRAASSNLKTHRVIHMDLPLRHPPLLLTIHLLVPLLPPSLPPHLVTLPLSWRRPHHHLTREAAQYPLSNYHPRPHPHLLRSPPEVSSGSPSSNGAKEDKPQRQPGRPRSRIPKQALCFGASRSPDSSPTRAGPSLALKADIQKMVGTGLKPHYKKKTISKEQYTNINRSISRMLYERVGDKETLEPDERTNLETEAKHEVQNTIDALKMKSKDKQKQRMVATDTDGDL